MSKPAEDFEQLVRESLAALNAGDYERALEHCHPDVVLKRIDGSPDERDLVHGREAVLEYLAPDLFERQELIPLRILTGPDSVLIHGRFRARGAGSGLEFETESYVVYEVRDGLVTRIASYRDRAEAERAAGLEL